MLLQIFLIKRIFNNLTTQNIIFLSELKKINSSRSETLKFYFVIVKKKLTLDEREFLNIGKIMYL